MGPEEQKKHLRSAGQSLLGCAGLIAVIAVIYFLAGFTLRHSTSSDAIVFIDRRLVQNAIFGGGAFAIALLFIALATMKTRGLVITLIVVAAIVYFGLYRPFAGIAFRGDTVELQHVWPWPATILRRSDIVSADWRMSTRLANDTGEATYVLVLRTKDRTYQAFADANFEDVRSALQRLR